MNAASAILLQVFAIYLAAKVAGELATRLRQPPVIGELLAGMLIGPYALGLIGLPGPALVQSFGSEAAASSALNLNLETLGQIGVIVLLFSVGLETHRDDLARVGWRAFVVATLGVIAPFVLGAGLLLSLGRPAVSAVFVGAALVATSVGITARVLGDLGRLGTREARIILGAAVIDDVLGLLVLAVVAGLSSPGAALPLGVVVLLLEAVGFTLLVALAGTPVLRRWNGHVGRLRITSAPLVVALVVCLGLAALGSAIGLAAVVGAYLAGMAFAEVRERYELRRQVLPLYEFLVPFFFVVTGSQVDWHVFVDGRIIGLALLVTGLAIVGKLLGCGLGAAGLGARSMAIIGVGMVPRGEVGLIVAGLGNSLGALPPDLFSVVVVVSVLTTLLPPPFLKLLFATPSGGANLENDSATHTRSPLSAS